MNLMLTDLVEMIVTGEANLIHLKISDQSQLCYQHV